MANTRIGYANLWDEAIVDAVTSEASSYFLITNTQNGARDSVWRSTTGSPPASQVITWHYPSNENRTAGVICMQRHKEAGCNWRLELFQNIALGGTTMYDSTAVAARAAIAQSGWTYGGADSGSSTYTDPYNATSPSFLWLAAATAQIVHKSGRLTFSGTPTNQSYHEVCQLFLGPYFEFARNISVGSTFGWASVNGGGDRSGGGSDRTTVGELYRRIGLTINNVVSTDRVALDDVVHRLCGGQQALLSCKPTAGDRDERNYTAIGKFSQMDDLVMQDGKDTIKFQFAGN